MSKLHIHPIEIDFALPSCPETTANSLVMISYIFEDQMAKTPVKAKHFDQKVLELLEDGAEFYSAYSLDGFEECYEKNFFDSNGDKKEDSESTHEHEHAHEHFAPAF